MDIVLLERMNKAGLKFLASLTPSQTYIMIVEEAIKLAEAHTAALFLVKDGQLERVATYPATLVGGIEPRKKGFTYRAYKMGKVLVSDPASLKRVHPELKGKRLGGGIFIPLSYQGKSIGTLSLMLSKESEMLKKNFRVLEIFGSYASLAIHKAELFNEIQEALSNRDLFISLAAHELRTPTTTIYGYAQLLFDKTKDEDSVESRWISALHAESYRLSLLIKDLLEINRIKMGQLQYVLKECFLREVVERAIDNFKFNYPKREIIFEDHTGKKEDTVVGDFDKLLQVILNLLDNAAKFSPEETKITINLNFKSRYFTIQVKDRGKGISKKDLSKVFQGFYKGKDALNEGMGLGLFLCKSIIEAHRGTIHLHSRVGRGTLVEIRLPQAKYG